jgi:hypothetical protein
MCDLLNSTCAENIKSKYHVISLKGAPFSAIGLTTVFFIYHTLLFA